MKHILSVVILLVVSAQLRGQEAGSKTPSVPAISAAMQQFVDDGEISGAVTLVANDGEIVHLSAVGLADLDSQRTMRADSMFSIASMTKPIVATAVMILQDEGKLRVDDKVSKYIPAFADAKLKSGERSSREITIRDVLTHTSGLTGSQVFGGSIEEGAEELARRPLAFEPGSRWSYSPGLNVAARVIETVAERPLQEFLNERIIAPLQMNDTTFFPKDAQKQRVATLYAPGDAQGSLKPTKNFITDPSIITAPQPSGGLYSTARDMFRFYQMVLYGGTFGDKRIVSENAVKQMTSPQSGELQTGFTPGNCWGLGWCIVRQPQAVTEHLSAGTFGHGGAFGTQGWVDPQTKTIYVLMIQRTGLPNSDASDMRKKLHELGAKIGR